METAMNYLPLRLVMTSGIRSVSPQSRSPFSAFVKLFVRTVYKYGLFCSLHNYSHQVLFNPSQFPVMRLVLRRFGRKNVDLYPVFD